MHGRHIGSQPRGVPINVDDVIGSDVMGSTEAGENLGLSISDGLWAADGCAVRSHVAAIRREGRCCNRGIDVFVIDGGAVPAQQIVDLGMIYKYTELHSLLASSRGP